MNKKYLDSLCAHLESGGYNDYEIKEIPYGVQLKIVNAKNATVRVYENKKGKITLDLSQVKDENIKSFIASFETSSSDNLLNPPLIGSDEAGKGDYFGPLCVCAVYADKKMYDELASCSVKDSKKLTDSKIASLKDDILRICPHHSLIEVKNISFNDMYKKYQNINVILSKAHASALKNVYQKTNCTNILIDKFSSEYRMENELSSLNLNIVQKPKAEQNLAVASASILARYFYMKRLEMLSETYGVDFCAGSGANADIVAKEFCEKYGKDKLYEVCKINFKNTQKVD